MPEFFCLVATFEEPKQARIKTYSVRKQTKTINPKYVYKWNGLDAVSKRKHSKNPLTLTCWFFFLFIWIMIFLLYLELQRSAEQMMRCESAAARGLRSDKCDQKAHAQTAPLPSPHSQTCGSQTCMPSLLAWHQVYTQPCIGHHWHIL